MPTRTPQRDRADAQTYADAARDAAHRFIGRFAICGVGLTHVPQRRIVFLLARTSETARREIERWAETASIRVTIRVSRTP